MPARPCPDPASPPACTQDKTDAECASYASLAAPEIKGAVAEVSAASANVPKHAPKFVKEFLSAFQGLDVAAFENAETCSDLEAAVSSLCTVMPVVGPIVAVSAVFAILVVCCACMTTTAITTCICCFCCLWCNKKARRRAML